MSNPLVSIVIPGHNQGRYLTESVDSAVGQSYPAVEVIVVDNASTDDTDAVARNYGDRIHYIKKAENSGASAARNTGIAATRGDYLKFVDADDSLHPDQVAWQMEALAGRTDAVSFTTTRLFQDGQPDRYIDHIPTARNLLPDLFSPIDWGNLNGFLIPAGAVRAAGGFAETVWFAEDWSFLCQLGLLDLKLLTDPRVGCYYRLRSASMSTKRQQMNRSRAHLLIGLHDAIQPRNRPDWYGPELLGCMQRDYHGLVMHETDDPVARTGLLDRIRIMQRHLGTFGEFGWRFRLMARVLGYANAEALRCWVVRRLGRKPVESLDTESWREQKG
jgi:glycosyltransferase involved in cell wall biosynthesis